MTSLELLDAMTAKFRSLLASRDPFLNNSLRGSGVDFEVSITARIYGKHRNQVQEVNATSTGKIGDTSSNGDKPEKIHRYMKGSIGTHEQTPEASRPDYSPEGAA